MEKLVVEKSGRVFLESEFCGEVTMKELPAKDVESIEIKNINPNGPIEVALVLTVDEIDVKYARRLARRRIKE